MNGIISESVLDFLHTNMINITVTVFNCSQALEAQSLCSSEQFCEHTRDKLMQLYTTIIINLQPYQ